jgi:3-methyladenine DNA glycosylase AlkD
MPVRKQNVPAPSPGSIAEQVAVSVDWLKSHGTRATRDAMVRYGVPSDNAFGVTVSNIQVLAKRLGRSHALAAALWDTGWYEARMLTAYVDEPAQVTPAQMDRWCHDFDNWGICDTVCFVLFDRTPHAWKKVAQWSGREDEFVKRAAFALLWGLTVHDRDAADAPFLDGLRLIERAAPDERHFVKKAVNMALRAVGKRNAALNEAAVTTAKRLADSPQPAAKWIGKDALRELTSTSVQQRLVAKRGSASARPGAAAAHATTKARGTRTATTARRTTR